MKLSCSGEVRSPPGKYRRKKWRRSASTIRNENGEVTAKTTEIKGSKRLL